MGKRAVPRGDETALPMHAWLLPSSRRSPKLSTISFYESGQRWNVTLCHSVARQTRWNLMTVLLGSGFGAGLAGICLWLEEGCGGRSGLLVGLRFLGFTVTVLLVAFSHDHLPVRMLFWRRADDKLNASTRAWQTVSR
jgi:hypothetical protein